MTGQPLITPDTKVGALLDAYPELESVLVAFHLGMALLIFACTLTVVVAAYRDDGALISSGINAGERIVSAGVHKLTAGEKVRPIDAGNMQ